MSTDRERDRDGRIGDEFGPSSSGELLDLVRSAEDEARLALRKRTPAVPTSVTHLSVVEHAQPTDEGRDVVEVGDEAVDLPPSHPPLRAATPAGAFEPSSRSSGTVQRAAGKAHQPVAESPLRPLPPMLAIALVFALAVLAIALVAR